MSEKKILVQGAVCKCKFGSTPDKLMVKTHEKEYANDKGGSKKLIASTKDIGGSTLEKNSFGSCAKMRNRPCKPVIQEWLQFYEKLVLTHGGKVLTEESRASCPTGAPGCIEVLWHGQTAAVSAQNLKHANENALSHLNPAIDSEEVENELNESELDAY